jgi:3-hydroxybutyryl-CoA dehydrogenase
MLEAGVASRRYDRAIKLALYHPMGPFEMTRPGGVDTRLRIYEYLYDTLGERFGPSPIHGNTLKAGGWPKSRQRASTST